MKTPPTVERMAPFRWCATQVVAQAGKSKDGKYVVPLSAVCSIKRTRRSALRGLTKAQQQFIGDATVEVAA